MTTLIADINTALPFIAGSCLVAMAIGFIFMYVMKIQCGCCSCVGCVVWGVVLLILLLSSALTYLCMDMSVQWVEENPEPVGGYPEGSEVPVNYALYVFYGMAVFTFLLFIGVCCLYSRIRIAI